MSIEQKVKFKLIAGKHTLGTKKLKPGDVFEAYPDTVAWMGDRVKMVGPLPAQSIPSPRIVMELEKKHKGAGRYDVINKLTGEPINDRLLSSKEADALVEHSKPDGKES